MVQKSFLDTKKILVLFYLLGGGSSSIWKCVAYEELIKDPLSLLCTIIHENKLIPAHLYEITHTNFVQHGAIYYCIVL